MKGRKIYRCMTRMERKYNLIAAFSPLSFLGEGEWARAKGQKEGRLRRGEGEEITREWRQGVSSRGTMDPLKADGG